MGNYALILVAAGVIIGSTMMFNSRKSVISARTPVSDNHFKTLAREASMTGLNWTVRRLVADTTSWKTNLQADPNAYGTGQTPQDYHQATFTTKVLDRYSASAATGSCFPDTVDVVSTGRAIAGVEHRHEVIATYVRTCADPGAAPPWTRYATVSDLSFDIEGEVRVWSADAAANADVHSNDEMNVTDKAFVEGFGSQSNPSGGGCSDPCDTIFDPNDDTNGAASNFLRGEPEVEISPLVAAEWLPRATYVERGDVRINSNSTIDFTNYQGITSHGTGDNPFIWYIPGDLEVNADLFQMIGYVIVIVEGGVKVDGDAQFITGVPAGETPPRSTYDSPNKSAVRSWMATHMPDGTSMGLYAAGCYDGDCGNSGIHLNGNAVVVGQLFANHDLSVNGDATVFGAMTTLGDMLYNGKNVLWYTSANEAIVESGSGIVEPDGVRLLSLVEF